MQNPHDNTPTQKAVTLTSLNMEEATSAEHQRLLLVDLPLDILELIILNLRTAEHDPDDPLASNVLPDWTSNFGKRPNAEELAMDPVVTHSGNFSWNSRALRNVGSFAFTCHYLREVIRDTLSKEHLYMNSTRPGDQRSFFWDQCIILRWELDPFEVQPIYSNFQ